MHNSELAQLIPVATLEFIASTEAGRVKDEEMIGNGLRQWHNVAQSLVIHEDIQQRFTSFIFFVFVFKVFIRINFLNITVVDMEDSDLLDNVKIVKTTVPCWNAHIIYICNTCMYYNIYII